MKIVIFDIQKYYMALATIGAEDIMIRIADLAWGK